MKNKVILKRKYTVQDCRTGNVQKFSLSQARSSETPGPSSRILKMSELKQNTKSRSGHKGYVKQLLAEIDACLENYSEERKHELSQWKEALQEQLVKYANLSDDILEIMEADEKVTDEELTAELYESNKMKIDIKTRLAAINERLTSQNAPELVFQPSPSPPIVNPPQQQSSSVRARLPKLEVREFGGNISE